MYWNQTKECMDRGELKKLQSERLVKMVSYVYHNVPYYREKMQKAGVEPGDIRGLEDIEKLPFTTYEDLNKAYPFGLAAVPKSELVRVHASSGTTGKPKIAVYTRRDIDTWSECAARCLTMAGVTRDDVIQVGYGYGLFTGGLGAHYGAEYVGALVLPMSTGNTKKLIDMMIDCGATAIACTPSYLLHVAEDLQKAGLVDKIKLKTAICGAEPWTNEMRASIEKQLGIKAYDIYGLTEILGPGVAADCDAHAGLHIWEDHFLPEILDPATLKAVPEGQSGELVITTLTKEGMPMIRYRTKDLTSLETSKCSCGRTMARIQRFKGRTDDMLIIRGVNVFPSQVEAALLTIDGTTPHYMIIVDRVDNADTFEVQVEVDERFFSDEVSKLENLSKQINAKLREALGLNAKVSLVQPNPIPHRRLFQRHRRLSPRQDGRSLSRFRIFRHPERAAN